MSAFPDWQRYAIRQKRPASGCIPTGYEMLLRAAGLNDIDFSTFQDEFDLDKNRQPNQPSRNDFESVAKAIRAKYPHVNLEKVDFAKGEGEAKLKFLEKMISNGKPVLVSLSLAPFNQRGWHIMLVVDSAGDELTLLYGKDENGDCLVIDMKKSDFVSIHDHYDGGNDIAFLGD